MTEQPTAQARRRKDARRSNRLEGGGWQREWGRDPSPAARSEAMLADCRCPGDCIRDHEHE